MTITNLQVKDLGDIVEAEYSLSDGVSEANVSQQIQRTALLNDVYINMVVSQQMQQICDFYGWIVIPDDYLRDNLLKVTSSYLKQNLK